MTGEADQSAACAAAATETKNAVAKTQPTETPADKKLSNSELKKRAKEEKAARRAAAKSALPLGPASQPPQQATGAAAAADKAAKAKAKHDGQLPHARPPLRPGLLPPMAAKETKAVTVPECFSHLSVARRIPLSQADKDVHPVVLALGQHMAAFAVSDSITRLETTLLAFKKVIDAYSTPHGATFSRHFTSHVLNPQIDYLTACRPMCFAMGNAIRWLKLQISRVDIDKADADVKRQLCQAIDSFIHERITVADLVIVEAATAAIDDGAVVVTYARHHLVECALLRARAAGKCFRVILIDDAYERVGIELAKTLAAAAITVSYVSDLSALRSVLQAATLVLVAAEAMFSNGAMYARAGTADIAAAAADFHLTVVALCESINFTERLSIDSLTYNEIDPNLSSDDGFRLLFDTTHDKYLSVVVTELGNTSAKSVLDILRKLEEL